MSTSCEKELSMAQGTSVYAADQLAELQLLTRADQHDVSSREFRRPPLVRGGSTLMLDIEEHPDEENADDEDGETAIELPGGTSFTALFAASRRLAGTSPTSNVGTLAKATTSDSPRQIHPVHVASGRDPTTLPTLCEEHGDPATENSQESSKCVDQDDCRFRNASGASPLGPCCTGSEELEEDCSTKSDPAFEEMLEQLHYDLNFLALSVPDITAGNLLRARDAIACSSMLKNSNRHPEGPDEAKNPLIKMRLVRTMMGLDTLRLLLLRYEEEEVLLAVATVIRQVFEQYASHHGVSPLSHSHCVLTASNIARVVLVVSDTLTKQYGPSLSGNNIVERGTSPSRHQRSSGSPSKSSSLSPSRWLARRSPVTSPSKASSRYATPASPCSPSSSSSSSSLRRSILASDGVHVLLSEKLAAFQHRGDVNRLPAFKVRHESADAIEEATRRRQRSIQYGNEATKALRG